MGGICEQGNFPSFMKGNEFDQLSGYKSLQKGLPWIMLSAYKFHNSTYVLKMHMYSLRLSVVYSDIYQKLQWTKNNKYRLHVITTMNVLPTAMSVVSIKKIAFIGVILGEKSETQSSLNDRGDRNSCKVLVRKPEGKRPLRET
jgi:hypothetical protein